MPCPWLPKAPGDAAASDSDIITAEGECFDLDCALSAVNAGLEEMQNLCSGMEESLSGLADVQARVTAAFAALQMRCIIKPSDAPQSKQPMQSDARPETEGSEVVEGRELCYHSGGRSTFIKSVAKIMASTSLANAETSHGNAQLPELHQEYEDHSNDEHRYTLPAAQLSLSMDRHRRLLTQQIRHQKATESIMQLQKSELARHQCVMDPHSRLRIAIDVNSMIVLGFDLFVIPVVLAWNIDFAGWIFYAVIGSLLHWTFDIFATFRTAIYLKGVLEYSPRVLAKHYLHTWFAIDLLVVVVDWISAISMVFEGSEGSEMRPEVKMLRFVKVGRALGLLKVMRMRTVMNILDKLAEWYLPVGMEVVASIVKIIFLILWTNHVLACAWYAMGSHIEAAHTDTGLRWTDAALVPGSDHDYHASGMYAYFSALHWALCQMTPGSLQVNPVNSIERCFTILCLIVGMLFFSSLVSSMSMKLAEIRMSKEKATAMQSSLQQFLAQTNVGKVVSLAAQKELAERLSRRVPLMSKDVKALPLLSSQLQMDISRAMFVSHLKRKALFRWWTEVEHSAVSQFCHNSLEFTLLWSGDSLFHPGEDAPHAFIVVAGQLQYTWSQSDLDMMPEVQEAKTGAWLSEAALWFKWKHVGTMLASTQCELIVIRVQGLLHHLNVSREGLALKVFADYARCFRAVYEQANFMGTTSPTDSAVMLVCPWQCPVLNDMTESSLKEILPSMRADSRDLLGLVALECLKHNRGFRSLMSSNAALNQLCNEFRDGKCLLMLSSSGEVERLLSVIALRIVAADGMIFVRLGTWDATTRKVNPSCLLPGTRPRPGEKASDTLHRAITQDLAILTHSIRLHDSEVQTESKMSRRTGTRTEYRRTVYEASLLCSWSELQQVEPERIAARSRASTEGLRHHVRDICLLKDPDGTTVVFYGWLSPDFFEQCKSNERLLIPHLSALTVSQRNMDQMAKWSSAAASDETPCSHLCVGA